MQIYKLAQDSQISHWRRRCKTSGSTCFVSSQWPSSHDHVISSWLGLIFQFIVISQSIVTSYRECTCDVNLGKCKQSPCVKCKNQIRVTQQLTNKFCLKKLYIYNFLPSNFILKIKHKFQTIRREHKHVLHLCQTI